MGRVASVLLVAGLLTGCVTPQPSPTAIPSTAIAAGYLVAVTASNAATCTFNAALSRSAPTLADLTAASAAYADSLATLVDDLVALDWPSDLRGDADALIAELRTNREIALEMASAQTLDEFITADNRLIEANAATAVVANRVRDDLGLPSGGNPCAT
jgi:hypothetical protein